MSQTCKSCLQSIALFVAGAFCYLFSRFFDRYLCFFYSPDLERACAVLRGVFVAAALLCLVLLIAQLLSGILDKNRGRILCGALLIAAAAVLFIYTDVAHASTSGSLLSPELVSIDRESQIAVFSVRDTELALHAPPMVLELLETDPPLDAVFYNIYPEDPDAAYIWQLQLAPSQENP